MYIQNRWCNMYILTNLIQFRSAYIRIHIHTYCFPCLIKPARAREGIRATIPERTRTRAETCARIHAHAHSHVQAHERERALTYTHRHTHKKQNKQSVRQRDRSRWCNKASPAKGGAVPPLPGDKSLVPFSLSERLLQNPAPRV